MTATAPPPGDGLTAGASPGLRVEDPSSAGTPSGPLGRAEGVELLGPVHGSGYKEGAALVRRADGQIVQLGPLMYAVLESVDGRRSGTDLAREVSQRLGRGLDVAQVAKLAEKLAAQGLLAGTEHRAPPRRNPLLALHWKVVVSNPDVTNRLTAPFAFLFRPLVMWPVLAAFGAVFWFVLIRKGVASATTDAFRSPGLLLLVFALSVLSAGFHEFGHAAACRYGGATPGAMGMGMYLVFPAFYTDVTDAYRLPRRDRLRIDLAGLYFNAVVAVLTMAVWLFWRVDALLLLVALQILQMVKQLSPVIRADGYHILSDATGVPDLYAHMGPTLKSLLPWRRHQPTALTGRARLLVSAWVLIVVPVLISLMLGAVLLLPHLATSAWDSGHVIARAIPREISNFQVIKLLASLLSLFALILPLAASVLITQKFVRMTVSRAMAWSAGRPGRRALVTFVGAVVVAVLAWAWWPSGQYKPVRAQGGTIPGLIHLISSPRSADGPAYPAPITPGVHLAVSMIPVDGVSAHRPALFFLAGAKGKPPAAILSSDPSTGTMKATAFPYVLPSAPGPGGTQALAVNTQDGTTLYKVAYALVTVSDGAPVTNTNSAFAIAQCRQCTTVAVSFQLVLVIGQSNTVAPIDAAGALNDGCIACTTTAIADQMVVTLQSQPSQTLISELESRLQQLNALPQLGAGGTPAAIAAAVSAVQDQVASVLQASGLVVGQSTTATTLAGDGGTGAAGTGTQTGSSTTTLATTSDTTVAGSSPTTTATTATTSTPSTTSPSTTTPDSTTSTSSTTATSTSSTP